MEMPMASTPVEVKKTEPTATTRAAGAPAPTTSAPARMPDLWRSFQDEMERVLDRFSSAFTMPSLHRMFDFEPVRQIERTFTFTMPAIDVGENEKSYKITAELPGMEAKD